MSGGLPTGCDTRSGDYDKIQEAVITQDLFVLTMEGGNVVL